MCDPSTNPILLDGHILASNLTCNTKQQLLKQSLFNDDNHRIFITHSYTLSDFLHFIEQYLNLNTNKII